MWYRTFFLPFAALLISSLPASAAKKIALLIGNSGYTSSVGPLTNPHNDISLIATSLKEVGFEIMEPVKDGNRADMVIAAGRFAERLKSAGSGAVGFLYYSGHGLEMKGVNYLIPTSVERVSSADIRARGVKLRDIIEILKSEAPNALHYLVIDACRNNLGGSRGGGKGFQAVDQRDGMLIAFSTARGATASDQGEGSGPYAKVLSEEIVRPNQDDYRMFHNVRVKVRELTQGDQIPWTQDGVVRQERFRFGPQIKASRNPGLDRLLETTKSCSALSWLAEAAPSEAQRRRAAARLLTLQCSSGQSDAEREHWARAAGANTVVHYRSYLKAYPNGAFKGLAEKSLDKLGAIEAQWAKLRQSRDVEALTRFQKLAQGTQFAFAARTYINSLEDQHKRDWKAVQAGDRLDLYRQYLREWPRGPHRPLVERRMAALSAAQKARQARTSQLASGWEKLRNSNDAKKLLSFALEAKGTRFERSARTRANILAEQEADDWRNAIAFNELRSYRNFIEKWPQSENIDVAEKKISEIAEKEKVQRKKMAALAKQWNSLRRSNDQKALRSFSTKAIGTIFEQPANARASVLAEQEKNEWQNATAFNEIRSYKKFIDKWPNSKHREAAEARIAALRKAEAERKARLAKLKEKWSTIKRSRKFGHLEKFKTEAQGTELAVAAAERIAALEQQEVSDWNNARSIQKLDKYKHFLSSWPDGRQSRLARDRIAELEEARKQWLKLQLKPEKRGLADFIAQYGWTEWGDDAVAAQVALATPSAGLVNRSLDGKQLTQWLDGKTLRFKDHDEEIQFSTKRSPSYRKRLGKSFWKQVAGPEMNVSSKGAFKGKVKIRGRTKKIEGLGSVVVSKVDGTGFLFLMQMYGNERRIRDIERRDRLFSTIEVIRANAGHVCIYSPWVMMSKSDPDSKKVTSRCQVVD